MNLKMTEVGSFTSFLMDEAIRPATLIGLNGKILYFNEAFVKKTGHKHPIFFQDIIDSESIGLWDEYIKNINTAEQRNLEITIKTEFGTLDVIRVQLKYFEEAQQIAALYEWPGWNRMEKYKTYSHAFMSSEEFMVVIDRQGFVYDVNGLHNKFFKLPKEYFIGQSYNVLLRLLSIDKEMYMQQEAEIKKNGHSDIVVEFQKTHDDLRYYHITTFLDKDTGMYLIRMKDCTEKKLLEQRLVHSDSLSTVGELAASIAHEIRNPITTLKGFTQLLKLSATDDSMRYITVIEDEIGRMEAILSEMLVLSKPSVSKKTAFSLEVLVTDMIQVIRPKAVMEGITILFQESLLETSLIIGDADKIRQVLLNLFKNAFEAMSVGGMLTIQLGTDMNNHIVLTVSDTGKGMHLTQINQMFIPFFTSKPEGTGLGLPFVLKTVEEHGGTIVVESELSKGTKFILSFPQSELKDSEFEKNNGPLTGSIASSYN